MKIITFRLSRMRNAEYFQFMTEFRNMFTVFSPATIVHSQPSTKQNDIQLCRTSFCLLSLQRFSKSEHTNFTILWNNYPQLF